MSDLNFSPLPERAPSLTTRVYEAISTMLLDGSFKPDSRTSIRELAEEMGVSTMPVREAVGRLVAQGALEIHKNRAILVPQMSREDFSELTRTRLHLEMQLVRLAVEHLDSALISKLEQLALAFAAALSEGRSNDGLALNRRLHFTLYDAAASPTLRQLTAMTWLRAGPMISLDLGQVSWHRQRSHSVAAHDRLLAALHRRDSEAAAQAMREDIEEAATKILQSEHVFTAG